MNKGAKAWTEKYRTEIAASSSSVLSTFAAFPLDFAYSRMQSYNTTFSATAKDAYKAEGLRAFWRMSPLALANAANSYPSLYTLGCVGSAGARSGAVSGGVITFPSYSLSFELILEELLSLRCGLLCRPRQHQRNPLGGLPSLLV